MIMKGTSPSLAAIFTATIVTAMTICLINGFTIKALSAILATFFGLLIAGLTADILAISHHFQVIMYPILKRYYLLDRIL